MCDNTLLDCGVFTEESALSLSQIKYLLSSPPCNVRQLINNINRGQWILFSVVFTHPIPQPPFRSCLSSLYSYFTNREKRKTLHTLLSPNL
jgi:hypothetical protein